MTSRNSLVVFKTWHTTVDSIRSKSFKDHQTQVVGPFPLFYFFPSPDRNNQISSVISLRNIYKSYCRKEPEPHLSSPFLRIRTTTACTSFNLQEDDFRKCPKLYNIGLQDLFKLAYQFTPCNLQVIINFNQVQVVFYSSQFEIQFYPKKTQRKGNHINSHELGTFPNTIQLCPHNYPKYGIDLTPIRLNVKTPQKLDPFNLDDKRNQLKFEKFF